VRSDFKQCKSSNRCLFRQTSVGKLTKYAPQAPGFSHGVKERSIYFLSMFNIPLHPLSKIETMKDLENQEQLNGSL
jgi:hypothetical protein